MTFPAEVSPLFNQDDFCVRIMTVDLQSQMGAAETGEGAFRIFEDSQVVLSEHGSLIHAYVSALVLMLSSVHSCERLHVRG